MVDRLIYSEQYSSSEPDILKKLREESGLLFNEQMLISWPQAQFLANLTQILRPDSILEIGTFTGYSALNFALNTHNKCKITCLDSNHKPIESLAKKYWKLSSSIDKFIVYIDQALQTLDKLLKEKKKFDFIFIDADKLNYKNYYELALQLISPRGIVILDNMLWHNKVLDVELCHHDKRTKFIHDLNKFIANDTRVNNQLIPIGDGLMLCRKFD